VIPHDQFERDHNYFKPRRQRNGCVTILLVVGAAALAYVASPGLGVASRARWVVAGLAGLLVLRARVR
jgi:hypothetical protein